MPKLVKCQIAKERDQRFHCKGCGAPLKDVPETQRGIDAVFLCPECHCFFNTKGVIPYNDADEMFPGESDYYY